MQVSIAGRRSLLHDIMFADLGAGIRRAVNWVDAVYSADKRSEDLWPARDVV